MGARLRQQDMKYAFKAGMATAMLAAPAFFESTRPVFVEYRGEWALISVRSLCSLFGLFLTLTSRLVLRRDLPYYRRRTFLSRSHLFYKLIA